MCVCGGGTHLSRAQRGVSSHGSRSLSAAFASGRVPPGGPQAACVKSSVCVCLHVCVTVPLHPVSRRSTRAWGRKGLPGNLSSRVPHDGGQLVGSRGRRGCPMAQPAWPRPTRRTSVAPLVGQARPVLCGPGRQPGVQGAQICRVSSSSSVCREPSQLSRKHFLHGPCVCYTSLVCL